MLELEDDTLKCPHCGGLCLHHVRVDIHTRPKEDGQTASRLVLGFLLRGGEASGA
jgi:hypothetical protein